MTNTSIDMRPRLLPVKDAAAYLGMTRNTIFEHLSAGDLRRIRHGQRRTLIARTDLDALADRIEAGEFAKEAA